MTRFSRGSTFTTRPRFPRSLPAMTWTSSFFLTSTAFMIRPCHGTSQHLRRERDDLPEPLLPQLPSNRPEDAGPPRVLLLVDQHHRVVVELDVRTVRAAALLGGPYDHALDHLALLDPATGQRVLHGSHHHVTQPGVAAARTAQDADHQDLLGPRVVRHPAPGLLLDHRASLGPLLFLVGSALRSDGSLLLDHRLLGDLTQGTTLQLAGGDGLPSLLEREPIRPSHRGPQLFLRLPAAEHREDAGDVVPHLLDAHGVVQLAGDRLEAQIEQLLLVRLQTSEELLVRKLADL